MTWYDSTASGYATPSMYLTIQEYHIGYYYRCKITDGAGNGGYVYDTETGLYYLQSRYYNPEVRRGGFSTAAGWSGTVYNSITNAPDVSALEGPGYQVGGAYGWNIGYVPVIAGGDLNIIPIPDTESAYFGGTFATGFGSPDWEVHVDWTSTGTLPYSKINIFECAENVYRAIMEW